MQKQQCLAAIILCMMILASGCAPEPPEKKEQAVDAVILKFYPLDSTQGILQKDAVKLDTFVSADGKGSLRITTHEAARIRLFAVGDLAMSDTTLVYAAKVRSENLQGKAFLEMLCHFPGKGEYFSRALGTAVTGNTGWILQEAPFYLKKGQDPDNITLNIIINGKGTVWIDDIRLVKRPLP